jgi:hypothetical protein
MRKMAKVLIVGTLLAAAVVSSPRSAHAAGCHSNLTYCLLCYAVIPAQDCCTFLIGKQLCYECAPSC